MKKALDLIDLDSITNKNTSEWTAMRNEMAALKEDLKKKQELKLHNTEKQLEDVKKAIERISMEQESKNKAQFHKICSKMDALRSELKKKEEEEEAIMQQDIEALQSEMPKKGFKKFFRFGRSGNNNNSEMTDEVMMVKGIEVMSPLMMGTNISAIRPPSLNDIVAKKDASDDSVNSSENSVMAPSAVQKVRSMHQESMKSRRCKRRHRRCKHPSSTMLSKLFMANSSCFGECI
jgi:hypothetical protein